MASIIHLARKDFALVLLAALCTATFARADKIYVSNYYANTVGEYDATTGAPVAGFAPITGLSTPTGLALSGNKLYVASQHTNSTGTIGVYDAKTGAAIAGFTS